MFVAPRVLRFAIALEPSSSGSAAAPGLARRRSMDGGRLRRNLRRNFCAREMSGGSGGLGEYKATLERLVGLRRELPGEVTFPDSMLYRVAVEGRASKDIVGKDEITLFGSVSARAAALRVLGEDVNIDFTKLRLDQHYFQMFHPLPNRGEIRTFVEVADILSRGSETTFVIDTATRDSNDVSLMFNQFVFKYLGGFAFPDDHYVHLSSGGSPRTVRLWPNEAEDSFPQMELEFSITSAQVKNASMALLLRDQMSNNTSVAENSMSEPRDKIEPICVTGVVTHLLGRRFRISPTEFKGVKVQLFEGVSEGQRLKLSAWRHGRRLISFNTMFTEPTAFPCVHTGHITFY